MKILKRIFTWFCSFFQNNSRVKFKEVTDIPERYGKNVIYIVGENSSWLLTMLCPCGCQRIINLNTLTEAKPCWRHFVAEKKITIQPSVWSVDGCKSHFVIKKGSIIWVGNNNRDGR